ncbi:MAG: ABC transporter ATP-binding protein, partial [Spirochaetales bacterium]|nr:ABC transporter ATP-binding protein [Candidatus Physcosoma equi]
SVVLLVGAIRVNKGVTQPGVILAFLTYFQMILMGVMILNRFFLLMSKANASSDRIKAVIEKSDGLVRAPEEACRKAPNDDYIIFDDVSFSYGEAETEDKASFAGEERKKTLDHISFSIKKGGSLGIIGGTGSGKTTIINLLMRFYDTDEGAVFVDGKDVRSYSLDSLRKRFGVVFQNDVIFADTISGNIIFGRDVDEDALEKASQDALAFSFIHGYNDGFEHLAAIRGANFSGGQKQRLLIARALVSSPDILVLDDSSSALDYKTDAELRKNIRLHHQNATTIVVAQRISSIMSLDHILVLHEGKVIGYGTHEELLASSKEYQEIYETQMGEV